MEVESSVYSSVEFPLSMKRVFPHDYDFQENLPSILLLHMR